MFYQSHILTGYIVGFSVSSVGSRVVSIDGGTVGYVAYVGVNGAAVGNDVEYVGPKVEADVFSVGYIVGSLLGADVGWIDGLGVGFSFGDVDGSGVGFTDGWSVGDGVGYFVGCSVGKISIDGTGKHKLYFNAKYSSIHL